MKNVKMLTNALVLALTALTSISIQAIELVKVESLNTTALPIHVNTELAQSLKQMSTLTLNIEKSAEEILINQNEKQFKASDRQSTAILLAE